MLVVGKPRRLAPTLLVAPVKKSFEETVFLMYFMNVCIAESSQIAISSCYLEENSLPRQKPEYC